MHTGSFLADPLNESSFLAMVNLILNTVDPGIKKGGLTVGEVRNYLTIKDFFNSCSLAF